MKTLPLIFLILTLGYANSKVFSQDKKKKYPVCLTKTFMATCKVKCRASGFSCGNSPVKYLVPNCKEQCGADSLRMGYSISADSLQIENNRFFREYITERKGDKGERLAAACEEFAKIASTSEQIEKIEEAADKVNRKWRDFSSITRFYLILDFGNKLESKQENELQNRESEAAEKVSLSKSEIGHNVITGSIQIDELFGRKLYLERLKPHGPGTFASSWRYDTAQIDSSGRFVFDISDLPKDELSIMRLAMYAKKSDNSTQPIFEDVQINLLLTGNDSVFVTAKGSDISFMFDYTLENSPLNEKVIDFLDVIKDVEIRARKSASSFSQDAHEEEELAEFQKDTMRSLMNELQDYNNEKANLIKNYLDTVSCDAVKIIALSHLYECLEGISRVEEDPKKVLNYIEFIEEQYEKFDLKEDHPAYALFNYFDQQVISKLKKKSLAEVEGVEAEPFTFKDRQGINRKVPDGKSDFTLVNFWATWCGPCLKAKKETVIPLLDKYGSDKLQVVNISIDRDKERYKSFIERYDEIDMINIHLSEINEKGVKDSYFVSSLPNSWLINRSGKVVKAVNSHNSLERILKKEYSD